MRARGAVLTVALLVVTAGCAAESAPPAENTSTRTSPTTSFEVPAVENPLDVSAVAGEPCALLDQAQRSELGLPAAVPPGDGATLCDLYENADHQDPVNHLRIGVSPTGLGSLPAQCKTLDCADWTTSTLSGFPVVYANDDATAEHACKLYVGVADDAMLAVVDVSTPADCARAETAAKLALETLTGR